MHRESRKTTTMKYGILSALLLFALAFGQACASGPQTASAGERTPVHPGERIARRRCVSCHALPSPARRTPAEWRLVLDDMSREANLNAKEKALVYEWVSNSSRR